MKFLTGNDMVVTSPAFVEADGETGSATDSTPTVAVTSAGGQSLTVGTPVAAADDGRYTVTIAAATNPDRLTVVWTGAVASADQRFTQHVEVAGGVYLSGDELADLDGIDTARDQIATLAAWRDEFEGIAERWIGRAFVPRFESEVLRGAMLLKHAYPRSILSATDGNGSALVTTSWDLTEWGMILDAFDAPVCPLYPVTVAYTHGEDAPPAELVSACRQYVRAKVLAQRNRQGADVLRMTDPSGITEQFSTPDWDKGRPTGLLDVDRTLVSLGSPVSGIA